MVTTFRAAAAFASISCYAFYTHGTSMCAQLFPAAPTMQRKMSPSVTECWLLELSDPNQELSLQSFSTLLSALETQLCLPYGLGKDLRSYGCSAPTWLCDFLLAT